MLQAFDVKEQKKEELHESVSTLFGGQAEPKLKTSERPDVRADKQAVLNSINQEIKRFDASEMQIALDEEVDRTILKI